MKRILLTTAFLLLLIQAAALESSSSASVAEPAYFQQWFERSFERNGVFFPIDLQMESAILDCRSGYTPEECREGLQFFEYVWSHHMNSVLGALPQKAAMLLKWRLIRDHGIASQEVRDGVDFLIDRKQWHWLAAIDWFNLKSTLIETVALSFTSPHPMEKEFSKLVLLLDDEDVLYFFQVALGYRPENVAPGMGDAGLRAEDFGALVLHSALAQIQNKSHLIRLYEMLQERETFFSAAALRFHKIMRGQNKIPKNLLRPLWSGEWVKLKGAFQIADLDSRRKFLRDAFPDICADALIR